MFKHRKNLNLITFFCLVLVTSFAAGHFASATNDLAGFGFLSGIGLGTASPGVVLMNLIRIFLSFIGLILIILILYGGFVWMTSGGSEEKITKAKGILKSAIIGTVIIAASFGIVTYIINILISATGGGSGYGDGTGDNYSGSIGALGMGIVKSVYPEPNQKDVPRNTNLIVTFRETMSSPSICQTTNALCNGEVVVKENLRIFQSSLKDSCASSACSTNITNVKVYTTDNQTFVFSPADYLGSPSENIWHTVVLSNGIKKADGSDAFNLSTGFAWQFEVSSKLDLTPPQVLNSGIFPGTDDSADTVGSTIPAVAAAGGITVNAVLPQVYEAKSVSFPTKGAPAFPDAEIQGDYNCSGDGTVTVALNGSLIVSAGGVLGFAGGGDATGQTSVGLGCNLKLALASGSAFSNANAGNSWTFKVVQQKDADTLTVGSVNYTFATTSGANKIVVGASAGATAGNIQTALAANPNVNVSSVVGSTVNLTAKTAGASGNNINISTNNTTALTISPMAGGANIQTNTIVSGKSDKPMNSTIQITFNEAVDPTKVSGNSNDIQNYIKVVDITGTPTVLSGKFVISNQYRTVEFISDTECGVNACGETVYCLPANSNLRVELTAANLIPCTDCSAKAPFTTCNVYCQDSAGINFPGANLPSTGITDVCFNSLDGNRNGNAQGPSDVYYENTPTVTTGDNYHWSFWISGLLDLDPPTITLTDATNGESGVDLYEPITIKFDKVMMSSRLVTGNVTINNGQSDVTHQLVNIKNFTSQPIGYWMTNEGVDVAPADGEPESTNAFINHTDFSGSTGYRSQVGSGVRDIYQNCYKPAVGPGCVGTPSCCSGVPSVNETCP